MLQTHTRTLSSSVYVDDNLRFLNLYQGSHDAGSARNCRATHVVAAGDAEKVAVGVKPFPIWPNGNGHKATPGRSFRVRAIEQDRVLRS